MDYDVIWLLQQALLLSSGIDQKIANAYATVHRMMKSVYKFKQGPNTSVDKHAKNLDEMLKTVDLSGGNALFHQGLYEMELKKLLAERGETDIDHATDSECTAARDITVENFRALFLLESADPQRYAPLWKRLRTDATLGQDNYPTTWSKAFAVLNKFVQAAGNVGRNRGTTRPPDRSGRSFAQSTTKKEVVNGTDGNTWPDTFCYGCKKYGHISKFCPTSDKHHGNIQQHQSHAQVGFSLTQHVFDHGRTDIVNPDWLLLDSCSTVTTIKNPTLATNIADCAPGDEMRLTSTGGYLDHTKACTTKFLNINGYYNPYGLANICALRDVCDKYRVTMDSANAREMHVYLDKDRFMVFKECGDGLYYFDTKNDNITKDPFNKYSFLNTVAANKEHFHRLEIEGADKARILQQQLWWPSDEELKRILNHNLLINCDVTAADVERAKVIYGVLLLMLKGKMIRKLPRHY